MRDSVILSSPLHFLYLTAHFINPAGGWISHHSLQFQSIANGGSSRTPHGLSSKFSFPRSSKTLRSLETESDSSTISCSASSSSTWANASVCARGLRWCLLWFDCYLRLIRNHSIFPLGFLNTRLFYMAEVGQKASASNVMAVRIVSSCHLLANGHG